MLKKLRADTRPWHDRVEAALGSGELMSDDFQQQQYALLLKRLYLAFSQLEPAVYNALQDTAADEHLDLEMRLHKRKLLAQDLKALNQAIPDLKPTLALRGVAEAWGAFYVLEGSSLGGAAIYKHLRELNWPDDIINFYGFYGSQTGALWKEFREHFQATLDDNAATYQAVAAGAEKAYEVFTATAEETA